MRLLTHAHIAGIPFFLKGGNLAYGEIPHCVLCCGEISMLALSLGRTSHLEVSCDMSCQSLLLVVLQDCGLLSDNMAYLASVLVVYLAKLCSRISTLGMYALIGERRLFSVFIRDLSV